MSDLVVTKEQKAEQARQMRARMIEAACRTLGTGLPDDAYVATAKKFYEFVTS